MTAETLKYALIMLAAGIGVPLLAALNAGLGGPCCINHRTSAEYPYP